MKRLVPDGSAGSDIQLLVHARIITIQSFEAGVYDILRRTWVLVVNSNF